MKISSVIENDLSAGGGFPMSLSTIRNFNAICKKKKYQHLVITLNKKNIPILKQYNINCIYIPLSIFDKLFMWFSYSLLGLYFQSYLKILSKFEKKLIDKNIDLVNFVTTSPTPFLLQKLNFIFTVYDTCHIDHPEFSEVREYGTLHKRDILLKKILPSACIVLTESEELKQKLINFYNTNPEKIISILNEPSLFLNKNLINKVDENKFLKKNNLNKNFYYFYPAQFWEHKNHFFLLKVFNEIKLRGKLKNFKLVLCGGDKGNLWYVKKIVKLFKLDKNVKFLGFVNQFEIGCLYKNCKALIMPSFFGPTNIPPLDAWFFEKPVFYPRHLRSQLGEAAIYFDLYDHPTLVKKIEKFDANLSMRSKYSMLGKNKLKNILKKRSKGYDNLVYKLSNFKTKLNCWKYI